MMKKGVKVFLGVMVAILLIAICFGSIALYLKNERSKPIFELPELDPVPSVTALPTKEAAVIDYVLRLYDAAVTADDVEGAWHTDVHLGELQTPFAAADNDLVQYIRAQAGGQVASFYPSASELLMSEVTDVPQLPLTTTDVIAFSAAQGRRAEDGTVSEDDFYFIDFTIDPQSVDTTAMKESAVYQRIVELLAPAMTIESCDIRTLGVTMNCRINRTTDELHTVTITKQYQIDAGVQLTDLYRALSETGAGAVSLQYETVEFINFNHYAAVFTERQIAVKKNDMKALPASVTVHSTATKEDYKLTFDVSVDDVLEIDQDGVMTVEENYDEPVIVTMTLEYDGHVYTDQLTVYITEMELEAEGQNG